MYHVLHHKWSLYQIWYLVFYGFMIAIFTTLDIVFYSLKHGCL